MYLWGTAKAKANDDYYREMAVGNTFGATALSSYGGFWISFAIILTPGGFEIVSSLEAINAAEFFNEFGLYLIVSSALYILHLMPPQLLLTLFYPGLVHLHLPPPALHAQINRRLLHPLLHARHGLHAPRHRLPPP